MKCDGCTECCKLLDVPWMNSPAGELCKECDEGKGCRIYDTAPKKCLEFSCCYNQMKKVSMDLRPDKCEVVFEKITDDVFIGTLNPDQKKIQDVVKGQIDFFLQEGFSVALFNPKLKTPLIYPAQDYTAEQVWNIIQEETKKRYGSA